MATPAELVSCLAGLKETEKRIEGMRLNIRLGRPVAVAGDPDERPRLARIVFPRDEWRLELTYAERSELYEFLNEKLDRTRRQIREIEAIVNTPIPDKEP